MTQTAYIDETTGVVLAKVRRAPNEFKVTISPRIQELIRA